MPSLDQSWTCYDDPLSQFRTMVKAVGGQTEVLCDAVAASEWLASQQAYSESRQRVSLVEEVGTSDLSLDDLARPHDLASLEWAVLPGEFGVAENGAIWITDRSARHRAVYFLCENLVLVLPASEVVHHLHEAYERLGKFAASEEAPFGAFVSGPSKTADIEQSLVIGAQGPRSLVVLLIGQP